MWASIDRSTGLIREAAFATLGAGRTAMIFAASPRSRKASAELADVVSRCVDSSREDGAALAQALVEPHETAAAGAFTTAGFTRLADLAYLRRPRQTRRRDEPRLPEGVTAEQFRPGQEPELARALERSYVDTLDCPALCEMRDTADVIDSHRASGQFTPSLWWIIRHRGEPEGALLLNPCSVQDHIELVYLGVSPALRGSGLGARLLQMGLARCADRPERIITCAVDKRNAPALRLYEREGFAPFAHRVAFVMPLRDPPPAQR